MTVRSTWVTGVAVFVVALFLLPALTKAQDSAVPRTAWGAPDLQGVWDFRTLTPFELSLIHISEPTRPY